MGPPSAPTGRRRKDDSSRAESRALEPPAPLPPRSSSRASVASSRSRASASARVEAAATRAAETSQARREPPAPGRTSTALRRWLPADSKFALCGAEQPLFLALDKLDAMLVGAKLDSIETQRRVLKRLDSSLEVCGRAPRLPPLLRGRALPRVGVRAPSLSPPRPWLELGRG